MKRVYPLYVEVCLSVRRFRRNLLLRDRADPRLLRANPKSTMDFIVDALATGRMVRILSVVDVYTRECLAREVDTSLGSSRVTRVREWLIEWIRTAESASTGLRHGERRRALSLRTY